MIRVSTGGDRLDLLENFLGVSGRVAAYLVMGKALKVSGERVLLRCFYVADDVQQHGQRVVARPCMHEVALASELADVIVKGVVVFAPEERLANEIEFVRAAAEATIGGVEAHFLGDRSDSSIIITSVVKYKVANVVRVNTELLQRFVYNFYYLLAAVSAY